MGLFKPAWMSQNKAKALEAVERETNESILVEIANHSKANYLASMEAVRIIKDKKHLSDVALNANDWYVRRKAIIKLVDARCKEAPDWDGGPGFHSSEYDYDEDEDFDAIGKLNDQIHLEDYAKNGRNNRVREQAMRKIAALFPQSEYAWKVNVSNITDAEVREITDQALLEEIAMKSPINLPRKEAVYKLSNQSVLAYVAINDVDYYVRQDAFFRLTDPSALKDVMLNAKDDYLRELAAKKIGN